MSEKEIIKKQISQAYRELTKIREDIEVFKKERSKLQNELTDKRAKLVEELEGAYKVKRDDLEEQYQKLLKRGDDRLAKVISREEDANREWGSAKKTNEVLVTCQKELKEQKEEFKNYKENTQLQLDNRANSLLNKEDKFADEKKLHNEEKEVFEVKKSSYDTKKFQLDSREEEIAEKKMNLSALRRQNSVVLEEAKWVKDSTVEVNKDILINLEKVKKEKQEISTIKSMPNDLKKLEALKVEVEKLKANNITSSKANAEKKVKLDEQERSNRERERLNQINLRKVNGKIQVLNKIREDMSKSV